MAMSSRQRLTKGGGLYLVITEPAITHSALATAAVERGVPVIQLREKRLQDRDLTAIARSLRASTRGSETLLIVNDRPDIAAEVGADGVHLGRGDMDAGSARRIVGPDAVVGVSASAPAEIEAAKSAGADYVGVGPVYATATKPDARPPIGLDGLRAAARTCSDVPIVAIGGITAANARGVLEAGAGYVAVVSAICHADDPVAALDAFLQMISGSGP